MTYELRYERYRQAVEARLRELLPEVPPGIPGEMCMPELLASAMRYSLLAGGKRIRPVLLLATVDALGGDIGAALTPACALEMIHTSSLIHDDLPAMDDDTLRRGKPTCHVVYGEGQAVLAGDGLLILAQEVMLASALAHPDSLRAHLLAMEEIARATGARGMMGGQCLDLAFEGRTDVSERELAYIQRHKTGALLLAPVRAGALLCGAHGDALAALTRYGLAMGALFQTVDDILDVTSDPATLGKTPGKDAAEGKLTCVSLYGLDGARGRAQRLLQQALAALEGFDSDAGFLRELAVRTHARRS